MGAITTGAVAAAGTALSAGSAISGAIGSRKSRKNQQQAFSAAEEAGAFDPLVLAKPERLKVPGAGQIMGSYRGDIQQNYGQYEDIAQRYSASEQAANRSATEAANPNYYNVLQQLSNTALQAGRGVLPDDVKQQILQNANEDSYLKGFSYGKSGGGGNVYAGGNDAAANLALRNLGLSSLDMMKYGNALGQDVLGQTRSSRGRVVSTMDVTPDPALFQQQMNNAAIADYNYRTDKSSYRAGMQNAPTQAALNRLTFQTGAQTNQAAVGQSSNRMALESLTALGSMYGNLYPNGMPGQKPAATAGAGAATGAAAASSGGSWPGLLPGIYGGAKSFLFGSPTRSESSTVRSINS
jgi:hypothetical protein